MFEGNKMRSFTTSLSIFAICLLLITTLHPALLKAESPSATPMTTAESSVDRMPEADQTAETNQANEGDPLPRSQELSFIDKAKEASAKAVAYLTTISQKSSQAEASTTTTLTNEDRLILERTMKWAKTKIETSHSLETVVTSLPSPKNSVDFFKALEELKDTAQKKDNEIELVTEQLELLKQKNETSQLPLAEDQLKFFTEQKEIIKEARKSLREAFKESFPSREEQSKIRTEAFDAIAKEKADEIARIEAQSEELAQAAIDEKKKNDVLAQQARKELETASSDEAKDLAQLRLSYATLQNIVKEYESKALETELKVKKAEANFQRDRTILSETVPRLLKLRPNHKDVETTRTKWLERSEELKKEAQLLDKETNVLRDEVSSLRRARDEARQYYDDLDQELSQNRNNKIYRQRVFYARSLYRLSSSRLDLFRKRIELIEDQRKQLLRNSESFLWGLDRLKRHSENLYLGQTSSQISWFLLGLVITYVLALAVNTIMNATFRKLAVKSPWHWDNVAIEELKLPIRLMAIFVGLWTTLKILTLSDGNVIIANKVKMTIMVLWTGFVAWRILNVITRVLKPKFAKTETTLDDQLLAFVGRSLRGVVLLVTTIYLLENFGWKVSSLLAGLGIGGLAFALAAKDTLANFFGSIVLFIDRPFHIGNWVVIGGAEGIVEDIGIRSTRIRTFKDTVVTIPNANVANSPAENIHSFRKRRLFFKLTLRLDTPVDKVEQTVDNMRKILTDHPMILDGYYVYVTGIPADGIEIMVYCFVSTRDWGEWLHHSQTVYMSVLRMLEETGVGLAFSTTTVELESKGPINISGLDAFLKSKNDI